jgi:peptidoglycan lytic transglycosylase B
MVRSRVGRFRVLGLAGAIALAATGHAAAANPQDFHAWLDGVQKEARAGGISDGTLAVAFANLQPLPRVIELDRQQPEFTLTFEEYLARVVSEQRVEKGRRLMQEHAALLQSVARRYGVEPRFVVALWGVESDFGRLAGDFNVVAALATLAYDGRRSAFFRKELLDALRIVDQGNVSVAAMTGSWAGAMGQNQFMPSSFLTYAVDFDGDGRRDIWSSEPDVFASISNYLVREGWKPGESWGLLVRLPPAFDGTMIAMDQRKTAAEWRRLGVSEPDGSPLPDMQSTGSLTQPGGPGGAVYLVYDNYRTILRWNRSLYFATAVGLLADNLGAP